MAKKLHIAILLLLFANTAYAEEPARISMAIMEFSANNTKEAFAKASVDMLSEKLFATNLFTLMEKNQMDRIARLNGFSEFNMVDPDQMARLGKVLKVEKIAVGSITLIDSYIIDVKILNAPTGEIEFNVKRKISSIEKLDDALDDISLSIERHFLGYYNLSGWFDVTLDAYYVLPFAAFGDSVSAGPGVQACIQFNSPFGAAFDLQAVTGFYSFTPTQSTMDYFYMIPLYLCASYKFSITRNINLIPAAGAGYVFSIVSSDATSETEGIYWERDGLYYNPALLIRTELDIFLYDRWYLVFTPQYSIFFEKERFGQFASAGLGLKMLF